MMLISKWIDSVAATFLHFRLEWSFRRTWCALAARSPLARRAWCVDSFEIDWWCASITNILSISLWSAMCADAVGTSFKPLLPPFIHSVGTSVRINRLNPLPRNMKFQSRNEREKNKNVIFLNALRAHLMAKCNYHKIIRHILCLSTTSIETIYASRNGCVSCVLGA